MVWLEGLPSVVPPSGQASRPIHSYFALLQKKSLSNKLKRLPYVVRVKGLEPPSREALDPKSSVSTNFTTPARTFPKRGCKYRFYLKIDGF